MPERIFVTGARGLLGSEVIARLLTSGHAVVGLLHSDGAVVRNDGSVIPDRDFLQGPPRAGQLACVRGDVSLEGFGLDSGVYRKLRDSTELIVHCAAITGFGRSPEKYTRVNIEGTRRVIEFAGGNSPAAIPILYTSTAYVCGERPGFFSEADFDLGQRLANPYEQSKFAAENTLRTAMCDGLRACIVRPAIIVGDSRTGRIQKFDHLYTVVRITSAGLVRTLPGDYGATLDIVPIDWVADGVADAVENFAAAEGRTLHLTSGSPISLREINDVCAEFPSFHVPRYVPRHVFDRNVLDSLEKRYYDEVVSLYESYLRRQVRFVRDSTMRIVKREPCTCGKVLLRRIFDYAIRAGYIAHHLRL